MKEKLIISLLFLIVTCGFKLYAAESNDDLTEEQKAILRERVVQKTEEFFNSLSKMVDNSLTPNSRSHHQKQILNLFMGKGGPYSVTNDSGEIENSDGVKMWTSSARTNIKSKQLLRKYLKRLYDPETKKSKLNYTEIRIVSADAVRVDNITREGDHYVCIAYFYQDFYGIRDGRVIFKDRTCKKIKCYITAIDVPGVGKVFDAKLGDITVVSTQPIY